MKLNKTLLYPFYLLSLILLFSTSVLLNSCEQKQEKKPYQFTGNLAIDGKNLVAANCGKCHQLVQPDMLTKDVWHYHTLPSMAKYFGISTYGIEYFEKNPDSAKMSLKEWQTIVSYYQQVAPAALTAAKPVTPLLNDWAGFTLLKPETTKGITITTMIAADKANGKIYTADAAGTSNVGVVTEWDKQLKSHVLTTLPSPVVNAVFTKDYAGVDQAVFTTIGELVPMDFPNGKVISEPLNGNKTESAIIGSELDRPVQAITADFNKDGRRDWVISCQGKKGGSVFLMTQNADHTYSQSTIAQKTGAVQAVAGDFNKDGWMDLMVLYGYDDESLIMYTNDHKGGFTAKTLLHFPPVYGSTSFQLADLNHDGNLDLIYTCGYNYRDSRILKPYHGLYIFTNQGNWNFKQSYFYPIDGCTKAIANDMDGDGDLDIATIAFFADMKGNPAEEFIYFEQDKPMSFKPHAIPVSKYGRWFSMDVADYNGDDRPDILLGNYSHGLTIQPDLKHFWADNQPFIILQNNNKGKQVSK